MPLLYVILLSALAGCCLTLLVQLLLVYRRKPEPPRADGAYGGIVYARVAPEHGLREYLQGEEHSGPQYGPDLRARRRPAPSSCKETCHFLNAIFLFLFRELRDTALVRDWVIKKIKV